MIQYDKANPNWLSQIYKLKFLQLKLDKVLNYSNSWTYSQYITYIQPVQRHIISFIKSVQTKTETHLPS